MKVHYLPGWAYELKEQEILSIEILTASMDCDKISCSICPWRLEKDTRLQNSMSLTTQCLIRLLNDVNEASNVVKDEEAYINE